MDDHVTALHDKVITAHLSQADRHASFVAAYRARRDTAKLLNEIRKLAPPEGNRWNFRYIIFTLALVALSAPTWMIVRGDLTRPQGLLALASTAVGALAAFLSSYEKARESARRDGSLEETAQQSPIPPE